ncbi:MAG: hypothetical protein IKD89_00940 [Clostridia bacterium]|nr:hypothetical protein [Clostridia bacterium]
MKKKLLSLIVALCMAVTLLPATGLAEAVATIEGTVNASDCPEGDIMLTDDTTLVMDRDITLRSIRGNYNLTIKDKGGHTLTIRMPTAENVITANPSGHAVSVKSLTCDAKLDILSRKDGLNIDGDINFTGGSLAVTSKDGDAVYSRNGSISLTGTTMLTAGGSSISAPKGTVKYNGSYLLAQTTGQSAFCIVGQTVNLYGGTITASSTANCIVSNGSGGITLKGKITASAGTDYGAVINARGNGGIRILDGADITADGVGYGLYAGTSVNMTGDGTLNAKGKNKNAVYSRYGSITLKGDITASSKEQAIYAPEGEINVTGSLNAENSSMDYCCIRARNVSIRGGKGDTVTVKGGAGAIVADGNMNLAGAISATASNTGWKSSVISTNSGGNLTVEGGTLTLSGNGFGISSDGDVSMSGDAALNITARKGVLADGSFNKKSTGSMHIHATTGTALEADGIIIDGGSDNTVVSEDSYGIITDGDVAIRDCILHVTSFFNAIKGASLVTEGNLTEVYAESTVADEKEMGTFHNDKTFTVTDSHSAIFISGDMRADAGGITSGLSKCCYGIRVGGDLSVGGPLRARIERIAGYPQIRYGLDVKGNITITDELLYFGANMPMPKYAGRIFKVEVWIEDGKLTMNPNTTYKDLTIKWKPPINQGIRLTVEKTVVNVGDWIRVNIDAPDWQDEEDGSTWYIQSGRLHFWWECSEDGQNWQFYEPEETYGVNIIQTAQDYDAGKILRLGVEQYLHHGVIYSDIIKVAGTEPLTGSIVFTSGAKLGESLTTARLGMLKTMEDSGVKIQYTWQWSDDGVTGWGHDLPTLTAYRTINEYDLGKYLRVVATAEGFTGAVVSPAKYVSKVPANDDNLAMSSLTYADGVITVTRAFTNQEYVATMSASPPGENEWSAAVSPDATGALKIPVSGSYLNQSVFVHTRIKETDAALPGTRDKYGVIYTGKGEYLAGITLKNSSGAPVSAEKSKVGRIVAVTVAPMPEDYPYNKWKEDTVNWYVTNNKDYPGAVELYSDKDCTVPLQRDGYGVIMPTTQYTVYYKASGWTQDVTIGAEKTIGYNSVVSARMTLDVCSENDLYILKSMYFEDLEAFPGDEITTAFVTKPEKAYLGELTFSPDNTNPAGELEFSVDTASKTLTVTVPEDAETGRYVYYYLIDGVRPYNGTFVVINVREKTATVSFSAGDPGAQEAEADMASLAESQMAPQKVELGAQYILPENGFDAPPGYEFDGWSEGDPGDGMNVTEDVTVTARWKEHVHSMIHVDGYDAECTTPGMMEHWYCETCGKLYGDENGLYGEWADPAMYMIPAHGHNTEGAEWEKQNEVEPTCTEDGGYDMVLCCTICGEVINSVHTTVACPGSHTIGEAVMEDVHEATCTEDGYYTEVHYCEVCGEEQSREKHTIDMLPHDLVHYEEVPAACTEDGNPEFWECDSCGAFFSDENGLNEITDPHDIVLEATGHVWGKPSYKWSADNSSVTATVKCTNDPSHTESETVETSYEITVPPTLKTTGTGVYTAEFEGAAFTTQTKEVEIPKITGPSVIGEVTGAGKLGYTIEKAPEGAILIAVRYDNGRTSATRVIAAENGTGTITLGGSGDKYKLLLLDSSHRPLCAAWKN